MPTFVGNLNECHRSADLQDCAEDAGSRASPTQATSGALVRAGLVETGGKPLVTLHGLRHTCGSILLAHGVPLIVVSRHLGHANPNITAKVYSHLLSDSELDRVAEVFAKSDRLRGADRIA